MSPNSSRATIVNYPASRFSSDSLRTFLVKSKSFEGLSLFRVLLGLGFSKSLEFFEDVQCVTKLLLFLRTRRIGTPCM